MWHLGGHRGWGGHERGRRGSFRQGRPRAILALSDAGVAADAAVSDAAAATAAVTDAADAAPFNDAGSAPAPASRLLAVGNLHTCSVRPGGTVKCWGASADFQLGPLSDGSPTTTPLAVGLTDVVEVSAGYDFSCARKSDGHVWCWGSGMGGQLGNGQKAKSKNPVEVSDLTDAVAITSNWAHTCALRANGHIACWGNGGRIGDGTSGEMLVPKEPPGITDVKSVVVGWGHTCVVLLGTAKCWGTYNAWGQLGDGTKQDRLSPVDVKDLATASSIVSGSYHVCSLLTGRVHEQTGKTPKIRPRRPQVPIDVSYSSGRKMIGYTTVTTPP